MTPLRNLIVVAVLLTVVFGCKKSQSETAASPPPASQAGYRSGSATIRGSVILLGKPPAMGTITNQPCHQGAKPLVDETVVVGANGRLLNVIVYLEDAPPAPPAPNLPPVTLDQLDCRYVPHIVALRAGQTLHIRSSDPTLHNVHGDCIDNPPFNFALVAAGQSRDLTFALPERFPLRCDVHPWMKACVQVFSHPWFSLTDKDGQFELRNVPAGSYTLVAWQEKYGVLRQNITVADGTQTEHEFTFQSGL